MFIRPQVYSQSEVSVLSQPNRTETMKNKIYLSKVDKGVTAFGQIIYNVILVSEMIGKFFTCDNAYIKVCHYFSGRINVNDITNLDDMSEVFSKMTLFPSVSFASCYDPSVYYQNHLNAVNVYRFDDKIGSQYMYAKPNVESGINRSGVEFGDVELYKTISTYIPIPDIPDPRYPGIYEYKRGEPIRLLSTSEPNYKGSDFTDLPNLKIENIVIDFDEEEKRNVERNMRIRALLGSDVNSDTDPLIDNLSMGIAARNIAIDFSKADLIGLIDSCSLIFDNHEIKRCGFKSFVTPFKDFERFNKEKMQLLYDEFMRLCLKTVDYTGADKHFRICLSSNQYEIVVRISLFDVPNVYNFNNEVTVKMNKCESIHEYLTQVMYNKYNNIGGQDGI